VLISRVKRRIKQFFSWRNIWPLLSIIFLAALTYYLSRSQFFSLKQIICQLDTLPCPHSLEPVLLSFRQQNIFTLSPRQIQAQLTQLDPNLTNIKASKQLPSTLRINLHRRLPIAQLIPVNQLEFTGLDSTTSATLSGQVLDKYFRLDQTGTIYAAADQPLSQLPQIYLPDNQLHLGQSETTAFLVRLITALKEHFVTFETIAWLNPNVTIVKTIPASYAIIDSLDSIGSQVASLQYILSNSKIEEQIPTKIDLRFAKPVLTY